MSDIMLDTGSNRILVRRDLVPAQKLVEGEIPIHCKKSNESTVTS